MNDVKPEMIINDPKVGTGAIPPKPAVRPKKPVRQPEPPQIKPEKTNEPSKK